MSAQRCHGTSIISLNVLSLKPGESLDSSLQVAMNAWYALGKYCQEEIIFRSLLKEQVSRTTTLLYERRLREDIQIGKQKLPGVSYLYYAVLKT